MRPQTASASFTRPADTTAYASGDLIANSTVAASVAGMQFPAGPLIIRRAKLIKDDDDVTLANFRLHLFTGDPCASAPANGDNGALGLNTDIAEYLGSVDFDMTASPDIYNTAGNVAVGVPLNGTEMLAPTEANADIYGLLEARAAYTPVSGETFTVEIEYLV